MCFIFESNKKLIYNYNFRYLFPFAIIFLVFITICTLTNSLSLSISQTKLNVKIKELRIELNEKKHTKHKKLKSLVFIKLFLFSIIVKVLQTFFCSRIFGCVEFRFLEDCFFFSLFTGKYFQWCLRRYEETDEYFYLLAKKRNEAREKH